MERQSGLSELSVISWVSAIEGCPLSGVPLYIMANASITAVDLIQRKKLDSRNFYESNLTEARFSSLPNNDGTMIDP